MRVVLPSRLLLCSKYLWNTDEIHMGTIRGLSLWEAIMNPSPGI